MRLFGVILAVIGCSTLRSTAPLGLGAREFVAACLVLTGAAVAFVRNDFRYTRILTGYFLVWAIVLGAILRLQDDGAIAEILSGDLIETGLVAACLFVVATLFVGRIAFVGAVLAIADRYFNDRTPVRIPGTAGRHLAEADIGAAIVWLVLAIMQLQLFWSVKLTYAASSMADAMQVYDSDAFWHAILVEAPLYLSPYVLATIAQYVLGNILSVRWREILSEDYGRRWLSSQAHYRMQVGGIAVDNPDQRIHEDIPRFIDGSGGSTGLGLYSFSLEMITQIHHLATYAILLWTVSSAVEIGGVKIPGLLFWLTLVYSAVSILITMVLGRSMTKLSFERQHFEGNYRYSLSRLREYSEQIALLASEGAERALLTRQFRDIVRNFYALVLKRALLSTFNRFLTSFDYYIPYIALGGLFFAKTIMLGALTQAAKAFSSVNNALTYFVHYYSQLADFRSSVQRLTEFDDAIAATTASPAAGSVVPSPDGALHLTDLIVLRPDGVPLSKPIGLRLAPGESVLISGPSGSGKSTLFRVLAGIWPFWSGAIARPDTGTMMILPQKPYMPIGALRAAVCYPAPAGRYDPDDVREVLAAVGLARLIADLEVEDNWALRLSGGELQRLSLARALLAGPGWLLLDEATSAQDAANEDLMYALIARRLPATTVISIAHRERLVAHHRRHLVVRRSDEGTHEWGEASAAEFAAAGEAGDTRASIRTA